MNDLKWIFLFVLEKQMSLPTLRFRINVQQNPYGFFGIDFHVINEKKNPTYTIIRTYLHDYSELQSTILKKKYVIMFILISVYSYIISSLHI